MELHGAVRRGNGYVVGICMAEAHLAAVFNRPTFGGGSPHLCFEERRLLMEGVSSKPSAAGTLGLSKLIVLYDSNSISIERRLDLAFTEDVSSHGGLRLQTLTGKKDGTAI